MQIFDTPGSVSLQFRLPSGRVVVTTADQPQTSVELVPTGRRGSEAIDSVEVTCQERAGGHVITVDEKERIRWGPIRISWGGDVEVRVVCPHGADLEHLGRLHRPPRHGRARRGLRALGERRHPARDRDEEART